MNYKIRVPQVRVLDSNGGMIGVMPTAQALRKAEQAGLDLVEITPNAQPPVCKIMDYGKFRYEESIREKNARKAQKAAQVKEIKFRPGTDTGDIDHKLRQIREFLGDGHKVKLTLQYRGRENAHKELGEDLIGRVLETLKDECTVEQAPKTLGRILGCLIGPPRKNKGGAPKPQQQNAEAGAGPKISISAKPENSIQINIGGSAPKQD